MSVQFGIWNRGGQPVDDDYFEKAKRLLAPYGPDCSSSHREAHIAINYQAFNTTRESRAEIQPCITRSGFVITWDGRLDNRQELISECSGNLNANATDVDIVAAAYEKWGTDSFRRLIGDWALSVWNPIQRSLILAKDPIGTRNLYYTFEKDQVRWSTILDPLVLLASKEFALEEEYVAGWLSFFPATHLTPYVGIHAVPPSSSVLIRLGQHSITKYWDFDPDKRIRYRADVEYEEHFRSVFRESVRRRLRSDSPVLAELSGGMDSSSIVCMADKIIAAGSAETPRLDTVSFYDDSEPNWNERPYFTQIEDERGRIGCHIDVSHQKLRRFDSESPCFDVLPGSFSHCSNFDEKFMDCVLSQSNRVVLSGLGGDEVTGGVPSPAPEIEDLIAGFHFGTLVHQLEAWALTKRKPWMYLLWQATSRFLPPALVGVRKYRRPAAWLQHAFAKRNRLPMRGYETRIKVLGALPSFQENILTLNGLRRQLGCFPLSSQPLYERTYPFLDLNFLEFLFSVPREQLVRPGQRRSLMRRSLSGLVPGSVLNRKRKAFVARAPMLSLANAEVIFSKVREHAISSALGIVDAKRFGALLQECSSGREVPIVPLMRAFALESWLRATQNHITKSAALQECSRLAAFTNKRAPKTSSAS